MQLSIMHVVLVCVLLMIAFSIFGMSRDKKVNTSTEPQEKQEKRSRIVGHEQATPMATRIAPAFAEQTDWSQFDQPAFLRIKKPQKKSNKRAAHKAEAPVDATPAQSKPATAPAAGKKVRPTPQQAMDEFRANAKAREANKPTFEQI